jgi:hypothetical protein
MKSYDTCYDDIMTSSEAKQTMIQRVTARKTLLLLHGV